MELYPEMNEKIKDILRVGGEPYLLYAAEYIERLEKQLSLAVAGLKEAADSNGGAGGANGWTKKPMNVQAQRGG